jgi:type IV pilus assembly protein PilA
MNRMNRKMNRKGFTMIELMVVVVVVGVLATIAVPMYGKYVKNARVTESTAHIGELITSAKAFAQESTSTLWPTDGEGMFDLTATENFTYAATGGGSDATGTPLVITATGTNSMAGVVVTVTVPNLDSNGNAPVVAGL